MGDKSELLNVMLFDLQDFGKDARDCWMAYCTAKERVGQKQKEIVDFFKECFRPQETKKPAEEPKKNGLSKRAARIFKPYRSGQVTTTKQVAKSAKLTRDQAYDAIKELCDKGYLMKQGGRGNRTYRVIK